MSREITILTPEHVELRFELAGLGTRFLAQLLDFLIQALALVVLIIAGWAIFNLAPHLFPHEKLSERMTYWLIAIAVLLLFALQTGYFLFFEAARDGQTPGKKAVGIKVIRDTGHPVDFRAAVLRNLMRAIDLLGGFLAIGAVSIFVSPEYRRLGDFVAGTLVVKARTEGWARDQKLTLNRVTPEPAEIIPQPGDVAAEEWMINLDKITSDDYRAIRHFLGRKNDLQSQVAIRLAAQIAGPIAAKLGASLLGENPAAFLERVAAAWERRMIH
jgi:uncharacterized RDD family membrane protein YckC